jgi:O-Antigen ligase
LFVTFSRAAWLAAAVAFAVGLAMLVRARLGTVARTWALAGVGALLLCGLLVVPYARYLAVRSSALDPSVPTEVMSTGERAILIDATGAVAAAHPLTGTGAGALPLALLRARPGLTFDYQPAPVVALDVAAELGLLGAACYGWLVVAPWLALARRVRRWTPELVAASAALAAVTVVGLFDYYTWTFAPGRIWAWLLLGLWAGAYVRATAPRPAAITAVAARRDGRTLGAEAHA